MVMYASVSYADSYLHLFITGAFDHLISDRSSSKPLLCPFDAMPLRLSKAHIKGFVQQCQTHGKIDHSKTPFKDAVLETDVFIAGSGPIGWANTFYVAYSLPSQCSQDAASPVISSRIIKPPGL